jgi:glutaconate CoA-transferase subunit B
MGVLTPDAVTKELTLSSIHPGVQVRDVIDSTAWPLRVAPDLVETARPASAELAVLRDLLDRTARAHGGL